MAVVALLWQTPPIPLLTRPYVRDNEIWVQTGSAERQLTHDSVPKRLPTVSPSGDRLFYVADHPVPTDAPEETIMVLEGKGKVRSLAPKGMSRERLNRLEWIDDHRIGAMTCGQRIACIG